MDFYRILQVSKNASIAEIKSSYRKLALMYHPDMQRSSSPNPTSKQAAEDRFKHITDAYQTLGDPFRKSNYDRSIGNFSSGQTERPSRNNWHTKVATRRSTDHRTIESHQFNVAEWTAGHYGNDDEISKYGENRLFCPLF
jgi:DnaJ-class molecular chaperone